MDAPSPRDRASSDSRCPRVGLALLALWAAGQALGFGALFNMRLLNALARLFAASLRQMLLSYASALAALGASSIVGMLVPHRSLVCVVGLASATLSMAAVPLAYVCHQASAQVAVLFSEQCGLQPAPGTWPERQALATVDAGFQELADALTQCRARDASALGLQDCRRELPDRGQPGQMLIDMALDLQQSFGCAGLCQRLAMPLFSLDGLSEVHRQIPSCHAQLASSAREVGNRLALWLGLVSAPSLLAAAAWALRVLDEAAISSIPIANGYLPVPCSAMQEMANIKV